ncbi:MAG: PTS sugar transporter subunit IIC [Spirochaetaceae bacterium]|jgi:fructoselysine and glucoselysine-specific PTS system IIC component|nr:PTS sugar transporter subunit IIC [Spirochaetaceae bacterium]
MDNLFIQAVLIFVVAAIGYLSSFFASSGLNRPLIMGMLIGLVLGDLKTGIITGATLELVWLGAMAIGASNPPDMTSGSILGTAYVITTNADPAAAVLLAVPVSMLMITLWNFVMMTIIPLLAAKADAYAGQGNSKGVDRMHHVANLVQTIPLAFFVALAFYLGQPVIERVVENIPPFITSGLDYAMSIIPAIGLALIARMILTKKLAAFLFLGFILSAYFEMSIIGITSVAVIIVALWAFNTNQTARKEVENGNEF